MRNMPKHKLSSLCLPCFLPPKHLLPLQTSLEMDFPNVQNKFPAGSTLSSLFCTAHTYPVSEYLISTCDMISYPDVVWHYLHIQHALDIQSLKHFHLGICTPYHLSLAWLQCPKPGCIPNLNLLQLHCPPNDSRARCVPHYSCTGPLPSESLPFAKLHPRSMPSLWML